MTTGTFACPICGKAEPHAHTREEVNAHGRVSVQPPDKELKEQLERLMLRVINAHFAAIGLAGQVAPFEVTLAAISVLAGHFNMLPPDHQRVVLEVVMSTLSKVAKPELNVRRTEAQAPGLGSQVKFEADGSDPEPETAAHGPISRH